MDCPNCQKAMIALELNQIEVDHCLACGGVWLDPNEMELLLEGALGWEDMRARMRPDSENNEREIRCPLCRKTMHKVRLDRDHGTWLDSGELHALVALADFPAAHRVHEFLSAIFRGPQAGPRAKVDS